MENKDIVQYLLKNEQIRYEAHKELCKTVRWVLIAFFACIAILGSAYMYFVVPVEEEVYTADHGSQIVEAGSIGRDNNNGR